jgi:hypothetical protein
MKKSHGVLPLFIGSLFAIGLTVYFFSGDVHWYPAVFGTAGTILTTGAGLYILKNGK